MVNTRGCLLQSGPDTYICLGGLVAELDKTRGCLFYSGPDTYICLGGLVVELDKTRGCLFHIGPDTYMCSGEGPDDTGSITRVLVRVTFRH